MPLRQNRNYGRVTSVTHPVQLKKLAQRYMYKRTRESIESHEQPRLRYRFYPFG